MKVEAVRTPCEPAALGRALGLAWFRLFGAMPARASVDLLLAQWAFETSRGRACYAWNLGNSKATSAWDGDFCERPCNELLTEKQAADALSRAAPRTDGPGSDVLLGGTVGSLRIVWFYASNPASRFRAFSTLDAGALDYLDLLHNRFASAWPHVVAGDPQRFIASLKASGYFAGNERDYLRGVESLSREYSHLTIDLTPPAPDTSGALTAAQDASLRDLSWSLLKGES